MLGLFQGMFEKNILTFNPGWDQNGKIVESFSDVREIQRQLKSHGLNLESEADEDTSGPASLVIKDWLGVKHSQSNISCPPFLSRISATLPLPPHPFHVKEVRKKKSPNHLQGPSDYQMNC